MTKPDDAPALTLSWQSAADIPAWVPLRHLRQAVALAIGEADAATVASSIMRAVKVGAVATRYGTDFVHWQRRAAELGHEFQDAYTVGAAPGGILTRPGRPLGDGWVFDEVRGIVLAAGDPAGMRRPGLWPVGPVDLAWSDVEALPAFRDAQARAVTMRRAPSSAPAPADGSGASPASKAAPLPWAKDRETWQRAQLELIAVCDEEGAWPLPGEHGGQARLIRYLLTIAGRLGEPMSEPTAKRMVRKILAAPQAERAKWPSGSLRVKKGSDPL
jgi:hypothetical protein